eukprot:TRINITY_DN22090_c0_g1_i2.p2 TRINITY_DN22090_c0_g1~~TRINITY_DN22090_c0_g1_i2.p2  ORF type:complete len:143 (-),score=9.15 TRINITY_DN22090_c0_g1_i2:11-439(-)
MNKENRGVVEREHSHRTGVAQQLHCIRTGTAPLGAADEAACAAAACCAAAAACAPPAAAACPPRCRFSTLLTPCGVRTVPCVRSSAHARAGPDCQARAGPLTQCPDEGGRAHRGSPAQTLPSTQRWAASEPAATAVCVRRDQ